MRNIVNISLPGTLTKEVTRGVKELHFASKSEFFRHLLREWMTGRLVMNVQESQREYQDGKAKKLVHVKDLWK